MSNNRKLLQLRYRLVWCCVAILSALLHFTGINGIYNARRKKKRNFFNAVLMYHRINAINEMKDMTVSPKNFRRQMEYVRSFYNVLSLRDIVARRGTVSDEDAIAVTFDDGFRDNYTQALSILKEYNIPATIFVVMGYVNQEYGLTKQHMMEMKTSSIEFGAHTMTHPLLSAIDKNTAIAEITESKTVLEDLLGSPVIHFAYPYGKRGRDFTDEAIEIVKNAGFEAAFSTDNGSVDAGNHFALCRLGVRNFPLFVLKCRLSGIFENRFFHFLRRAFRV